MDSWHTEHDSLRENLSLVYFRWQQDPGTRLIFYTVFRVWCSGTYSTQHRGRKGGGGPAMRGRKAHRTLDATSKGSVSKLIPPVTKTQAALRSIFWNAPLSLSPQLFSKATEITSWVFEGVSPINNVVTSSSFNKNHKKHPWKLVTYTEAFEIVEVQLWGVSEYGRKCERTAILNVICWEATRLGCSRGERQWTHM